MAHPEERLAELGLTVPEVAKPVAAYVPAVRSGNHVYTSGQLPMRAGELMTTGKVGGEVTPEEAAECAQQCALNAIAAVKAEIGDLAPIKRIVKVVCFVASTPDFTGQPQVANGASELLGEVFGDAGVHARSAVGVPVLPLDSPGRGRDRRRGLSRSADAAVPLPDAARRAGARSTPTGRAPPVEPRDAATVVLLRPVRRRVRRSTCCAGRPRWRSPPGMCVFPGGGVDPRDFDHAVAWAGPTPAEWAARLGVDEPTGAGAGVRRGARDVRGVRACCWPAPPTTVVADTTGDDWEADRVALEARELSLTDFLDRRGLVLRTDLLGVWAGWLTPVFEPKRYRTWFFVALLPEGQVTRDVSTESSSVDLAAGACRRSTRPRPATCSCCRRRTSPASRSAQYADPADGAGRGRGARRSTCSRPRSVPADDEFDAVDAGPAAPTWWRAARMTLGRRHRSARGASACSRRTRA